MLSNILGIETEEYSLQATVTRTRQAVLRKWAGESPLGDGSSAGADGHAADRAENVSRTNGASSTNLALTSPWLKSARGNLR